MIRGRAAHYRERVREELAAAFLEEHTPQEVAVSFTIGVFITALPTLGVGLLIFAALAYLFEQVSKIALFASVLILNPPVKWGVYATSFWLGNRILGPVPGLTISDVSVSAGPDVLARLWVGNLVLAIVFAAVGYVLALRAVNEFRRRDADLEALPLDLDVE